MNSGIGVADLNDDGKVSMVREAGIQVQTQENMRTGEERLP
ncbi:MAG: hypothetical protein NPIRA06_23180 [Nitrospirales bacterium]|nr:MAG: hypothetical protein NPIRA06_23180 [Nitrospirales bacterium]